MPAERHRFLVVLNRGSGNKPAIELETIIRDFFLKADKEVRFIFLPLKEAREKIRKELSEFYPHCVVAVGGDGTVNLLAGLVCGKKIALGIIPAGSANGMAVELKIPLQIHDALQLLLDGEARGTDLIQINHEHYCLHLADLGLNAQLVRYFERGRIRGIAGYAFALARAMTRRRELHLHIRADEKTLHARAAMIILANAGRYGTGAVINPDGLTHDGKFELVIVRKISFREFLKMFLNFRRFDPAFIEIIQVQEASVSAIRSSHFQVDGEYLGKVKNIRASILHGAIRLIVP